MADIQRARACPVSEAFDEWERRQLVEEMYRLRAALERIADGATGYLDRDAELASWARDALDAPPAPPVT